MTWLLTTVLKWLSGGMLDRILTTLDRRADNETERQRIVAGVVREEVLAEAARREAQKEVALAGMNHPMWWVAWSLFALPVGLYHAAIYVTSTFALGWNIQRVPATQEEWGMQIVQALFLAHAATGVAGGLVRKLGAP